MATWTNYRPETERMREMEEGNVDYSFKVMSFADSWTEMLQFTCACFSHRKSPLYHSSSCFISSPFRFLGSQQRWAFGSQSCLSVTLSCTHGALTDVQTFSGWLASSILRASSQPWDRSVDLYRSNSGTVWRPRLSNLVEQPAQATTTRLFAATGSSLQHSYSFSKFDFIICLFILWPTASIKCRNLAEESQFCCLRERKSCTKFETM